MKISEESLAALLDETIAALSELDSQRLLSLEERMLLVAKSGVTGASIASLLERQQVLGHVLEATQNNLKGLIGLHQRNGMDQWER